MGFDASQYISKGMKPRHVYKIETCTEKGLQHYRVQAFPMEGERTRLIDVC